jgi:uncharacterized protein (TIGR04141 family)
MVVRPVTDGWGYVTYVPSVKARRAALKQASRLLSIFLIKQGISASSEIFDHIDTLQRRSVRVGGRSIGEFFFRPSTVRRPSWLSFFAGAIDGGALPLRVASAAGVLLVRRRHRVLAVTFGHGRHLLNPGCFEENFGLLATLNSINSERVRQIDRKRFDSISRITREQAIRDVPIFDFGLELDQDILRSLTGHPKDESLGKRLSGRDSLSAFASVELEDLGPLLDRYVRQAGGIDYRDTFPWVDAISELRPGPIRDRLEARLVEKLRACDLERVWLVVPELVNWTDVGGFAYSGSRRASVHSDVHASTYLAQLRDASRLSVSNLRSHRVICASESTGEPIDSWSVYRCVYAEIESDDGTYLLDNGRWYRIDTDLVAKVDRELRQIKSTAIALPDWRRGEDEKDYNGRLAASSAVAHALMDRKNVRFGGGRSQVEFCDVFVKPGTMLHVKRYGGSSVLSHLFSQGVVSATSLLWDADFRRALNRTLPTSHRLRKPESRPAPGQFEVAFAIASKSSGPLRLPFFSRVTLRNAYRQLSNFGFRVTCTKIEIERAAEGEQPD